MANEVDKVDASIQTFVQKVSASPLFHTGLVFAAAVLVASEHKWPTVKQDIAYGLALLVSLTKAVGTLGGIANSVGGWFASNSTPPKS